MLSRNNLGILALYPVLFRIRVEPIYTIVLPQISTSVVPPNDTYLNYNVLNINGDTSIIGDNKTFIDSSYKNSVQIVSGNFGQGTFSPYSPAGWSGYFNGINNYLTIQANQSSLNFGTGDFTIEAWIYHEGGTDKTIISGPCTFTYGAGGKLRFHMENSNLVDATTNFLSYQWVHVAVVRSSGNITFYQNGVDVGPSTKTYPYSISASHNTRIGSYNSITAFFNGYISNLRVIKGQALYTSNFTPSTTHIQPLKLLENTSILTLQDPILKDNSRNNITITNNGVSLVPYSPLDVRIDYDRSLHGASVYFDGLNSNQLVVNEPPKLGLSDFTVECWVYPTLSATGSNSQYIYDARTPNVSSTWALATKLATIDTGDVLGWWNGSSIIKGSGLETLQTNQWNHCVYTRLSGTYGLFLNGLRIRTGSDSVNYDAGSFGTIGNRYESSGFRSALSGFLCDLRIVKDRSIYNPNQTTLTVPTAPLQAVSGTSLLLNFDNSGIIDRSYKNNVLAYGDAKISTSNSKFGRGAIDFDGIDDHLRVFESDDFQFMHKANAKFTIEFWIYARSLPPDSSTLYRILDTAANLVTNPIGIYLALSRYSSINGQLSLWITNGSGNTIIANSSTAGISVNTWSHVAVTWDHTLASGNLKFYINGVLSGTLSKSANQPTTLNSSSNFVTIGGMVQSNGLVETFNGLLEDLRITKGVRYTANFTPPTKITHNSSDPFYKDVILFLDGNSIGSRTTNEFRANALGLSSRNINALEYQNTYFNERSSLNLPVTSTFSFGSGDFTIEGWINPRNYGGVFQQSTTSYFNLSLGNGIGLYTDSFGGWGTQSRSESIYCCALNFDGSVMAYGATNYIYISLDYGKTWTRVTNYGTASTIYKWFNLSISNDGSRMIGVASVGATNDRSVFVSSNYGQTWTKTAFSLVVSSNVIGMDTSSDGRYSVICEEVGKVYKSSDYGNTWTELTSFGSKSRSGGNPSTPIAISDDGNKIACVNTTDGRLDISNDGGTSIVTPSVLQQTVPSVIMSRDGNVIIAASSTLYKSTNGGSSFSSGAGAPAGNNWRFGGMSYDGNIIMVSVPYSTSTYLFKNLDINNGITQARAAGVDSGMLRLSKDGKYAIIANNGSTLYILKPSLHMYAKNTSNGALINYDLNKWSHFAISRSSGTTILFLNGVNCVSATADTTNYTGTYFGIGRLGNSYFDGRVSNFRVLSGRSLYTNNFTPPSRTLEYIPNTVLLTSKDSIFKDFSPSNFTITPSGRPIAHSSLSYSTLFQANLSSYVQFQSIDFGTNSYTIECWVYIKSFPTSGRNWLASSNSTLPLQISILSNGQIGYFIAGAVCDSPTNSVQLNKWHHLAFIRDNLEYSLYVDGRRVSTLNDSTTRTSNIYRIGAFNSPSSSEKTFDGYITNFRVLTGTALYKSNFTPDTENLLPISGTALLTLQNDTIKDNSVNNYTITQTNTPEITLFNPFYESSYLVRNINGVRQTSLTPYSPNGWSTYFDGASASPIANNSAFTFGTGDFTIEGWVYLNKNNVTSGIFEQSDTSYFKLNSTSNVVALAANANRTWQIYANNTSYNSTEIYSYDTWHHFALVRASSRTVLYIDGVPVITVPTDSTNYTGTYFGIGAIFNSTQFLLIGHLSNFRVVKGYAVYETNFIPPRERLINISGSGFSTSLLTFQDNRIIDNSLNNFPLSTTYGQIIELNPFKNNVAYSPSIHGGSGYFGGSSILTLPQNNSYNFGLSDFTIEFWIKTSIFTLDGLASRTVFIFSGGGANSLRILLPSNQSGVISVQDDIGTAIINGTIVVADNEWHHVALSRFGSSMRLFVDGVQSGTTATNTTNWSAGSAYNLNIGGYTSSSGRIVGNISNLRIVNGAAVYTSNFSVPTSPVKAIPGTVLLLNFDNASIIDTTTNANISAFGNVRVDNTLVAPISSSTGSLFFNGSTDYLTIDHSYRYNLTNSDKFTIEAWVYKTGTNSNSVILQKDGSAGLSFPSYRCQIVNQNPVFVYGTSVVNSTLSSTTPILSGQWNHIAYVRDMNTLRIFQNGTLTVSGSVATAISDGGGNLTIGYETGRANSFYFDGYIDDLRITKNVARYTNNFTASGRFENPTFELSSYTIDPYQGSTVLELKGDVVKRGTNDTFFYNNSSYVDRSINKFSITPVGNPAQGTFSPFTPDGWSGYFNGSTDTLTISSNISPSILAFGTSAFTIEMWVYLIRNSFATLYDGRPRNLNGAYSMIYTNIDGRLVYNVNNSEVIISTDILKPYTWYHIAISRTASNTRMFINGSQTGSIYSDTTNYLSVQDRPLIGRSAWDAGGGYLNGYISNLRVVKNQSLYNTNFSPLSTKLGLTNTTSDNIVLSSENVVLLTLQDGTFKDNSNYNSTVSAFGSVKATTFNPLTSNVSYSPTIHGGSVLLDGSSYLTIPANSNFTFGTGDFTVEAYVYFTSSNIGDFSFITNRVMNNGQTGSWGFTITTSFIALNHIVLNPQPTDNVTKNVTIPLNQWNHVAAVRSNGIVTFYLNGINIISQQHTVDYSFVNTLTIGQGNASPPSYFYGYISNLRVVKGRAIIPPIGGPTSLVEAVSSTSLLLNFNDAGIIDTSATNNLSVIGPVSIRNDIFRNNSGSIYFDGNSSRYIAFDRDVGNFGTGDFTLETWIYPVRRPSTEPTVFSNFNTLQNEGSFALFTGHSSASSNYTCTISGINSQLSSTSNISYSAWSYLAITRKNGVFNMFVNGVRESTFIPNKTINLSGSGPVASVGSSTHSLTSSFINSYLDDFKITKGVSKYDTIISNSNTLTGAVLLLTGDVNRGASVVNNNTIIDSGNGNYTLTVNGTATQGSYSPYSPNGWSGYFDGSSKLALDLNINSLHFVNGDFTIEAWVYKMKTGTSIIYCGQTNGQTADASSVVLYVTDTTITSDIYIGNTNKSVKSPNPPLNTWCHVALVRSGNNLYSFLNGTIVDTNSSAGGTINPGITYGPMIGSNYNTSAFYSLSGYISNLRVTKGQALYTGEFKPSTIPLTTSTNGNATGNVVTPISSNVSLLTLQSNRFIDNSLTAKSLSTAGTPSIETFTPFSSITEYNPFVHGGSYYFNGSSWITTPNVAAFDFSSSSTNFTIEAWVYNIGGTQGSIIGARLNGLDHGWCIYIKDTDNTLYLGRRYSPAEFPPYTDTQLNTTTIPRNTWTHIALVKDSAGYTGYVNGIGGTKIIKSSGLDYQSAQPLVIGACGSQGQLPLLGYISNLRIIKGTAMYSNNFTPPTYLLENVSNTSLLLNFTNTGVYDELGKNNLTTVGNAVVSRTQSKIGSRSMYFDGSSNISIPYNNSLDIESGDFTVEFWVYRTAAPSWNVVVNWGSLVIQFIANSNSIRAIWSPYSTLSKLVESANNLNINTWIHICVVRNGSTFSLFVNGQLIESASTNTTGSDKTTRYIGCYQNSQYFQGYIDDLCITKGVAKYTSNFTPTRLLNYTSTGFSIVSSDYLVVAGGGAGGVGGGGGAGGYLAGSTILNTNTTYVIEVGSGGANSSTLFHENGGDSSIVNVIKAIGGGAGATKLTTYGGGLVNADIGTIHKGANGGSGGGTGGNNQSFGSVLTLGGSGIIGQGNNGGAAGAIVNSPAGGGGGAGAAGGNANAGTGGVGLSSAITGTPTYYAGGGGAGSNNSGFYSGGLGGGGTGARSVGPEIPTSGTANTGGGGGGGGSGGVGTRGGSGIVILRYPSLYKNAIVTGNPTVSTIEGYKIYTFTGSGTILIPS